MAEYLAPGVYVEEFDSGVKAMEGVGTSTAGFVGMAIRGNCIGKPQLITGIAEYRKYFGGYLGEEYGIHRFLSYAVEQFFANGGSTCYVMRAANLKDQIASTTIEDILHVEAKNQGAWGNNIKLEIRKSLQAKTVIEEVKEVEGVVHYVVKSTTGFYPGDVIESKDVQTVITTILDNTIVVNNKLAEAEVNDILYSVTFDIIVSCDDFIETYEKCSLNDKAPTFIQNSTAKSDFVTITIVKKEGGFKVEELLAFFKKYASDKIKYMLDGGNSSIPDNGYADMYIGQDSGPSKRSGLQAFLEINDVSIMAIPGICDANVQSALISHCENTTSRFAILDAPLSISKVDELKTHREAYDSSYAALYHPWLQTYDPLLKKNSFVPPSGTMAGVYARVDNSRGVWKAPANEVVRNVTGLSVTYNEGEQGKLNPNGINLIRVIAGSGIRVWGARTCSSDGNWKYLNVRRLFIFLEESIKANTNWAVFEPNDANLWSRVSGTIRVFLTTLWREGALVGSSAEEAFFVNVGKSTMTQDDILNGRLICVIGVAPVRPAEFVIFRITQKMEDAS